MQKLKKITGQNSSEKKKNRAMIENGKSEGERGKKRSLKTRHKKLKISEKPKSHTNEALTPLVRTRQVATMCMALPLRIKCRTISQEPCLGRKPFTF